MMDRDKVISFIVSLLEKASVEQLELLLIIVEGYLRKSARK